MRPLIIDDTVKSRIREQVAFAEIPENWYRPDRNPQPPGDDPAFMLMIEVGFRAVYTHTVLNGKHYRHLSVSVEGTKMPAPEGAFTIATLYGFTGGEDVQGVTVKPGLDWLMSLEKHHGRAVVIAQEVPA